jgi:hypothetical protein
MVPFNADIFARLDAPLRSRASDGRSCCDLPASYPRRRDGNSPENAHLEIEGDPLGSTITEQRKENNVKRLVCLPIAALIALTASSPVFGQGARDRREVSRSMKLPVLVDGVRYEADEMDRFEGQPLYMVYDEAAERQGVIFAFTTPEAVQAYGRQLEREGALRSVAAAGTHGVDSCSYLHPAVNAGPGDPYDWVILCPTQQISSLRDGYNDRISYVEAGSSSYYTVLYECYNFSSSCGILWVVPGATISDLNTTSPRNFNNITSSIRFCKNVDPFSCLQ